MPLMHHDPYYTRHIETTFALSGCHFEMPTHLCNAMQCSRTQRSSNGDALVKFNRRITDIDVLSEQLVRNTVFLHHVIKSSCARNDGAEEETEDTANTRSSRQLCSGGKNFC